MLGHMIARGKQLPMRRLSVIAYRSVLRNFNDQGRPQRWAPLSDATKDARDSRLRAKKSKGKRRRKKWVGDGPSPGRLDRAAGVYHLKQYQALQDTGALKKSIHAALIGRNGFAVRTALKSKDGYLYPEVHQYGTKPGTTPAVPARPFMVWQDEDKREFKRIIIHHIVNGSVTP